MGVFSLTSFQYFITRTDVQCNMEHGWVFLGLIEDKAPTELRVGDVRTGKTKHAELPIQCNVTHNNVQYIQLRGKMWLSNIG